MAREAIDVCLRMLKESNNRRFDSYSVRNSVLIISHITFRDCRVHINSCKHFVRSIRATRAREGFKLCAYLLSIYEYLVKQSISVVVLRAYALKKCITMRPATPKSYTSQLAEASHDNRKKKGMRENSTDPRRFLFMWPLLRIVVGTVLFSKPISFLKFNGRAI